MYRCLSYSDPFGLCPNPLAGGLGSLQCGVQDWWSGFKAGAAQAASDAGNAIARRLEESLEKTAECAPLCLIIGASAPLEEVGAGVPALGSVKAALEEVHGRVGKLPKGEPGKFGSPQRGNTVKGYRLDPGHPRAPAGSPEAGPHINWWDYSEFKKNSGQEVKGAVPIKP